MPARYFKWSYDMKKIILMLCLLAVSVTMYGCTSKEIHKDSGLMKITDDNGRQVAFSKKPERIVVLSPSFLELLEVLDGNVVGRAESTIVRTPDFAKNAAVVGFIFNINTEKVVELKPDLIVAYKGMHEKYIQLFEANGIPVVVLNLKYSILSGALTVAIIILPVIIRTTEEALKTVPDGYREASLALGSTKFQTLYKVVLPSAIPGILSGVILSVGRVVGESAAILLTAGTVAQMPGGIFDSARNLTVHAYLLTKEKGDIASAASIGIVLIFIVLFLNTVAKFVAKKLNKANY